ncbi:MAG TPA: glycosyltransferase family 87 protein, partial [Pirellulaceae bacterium]|nr:glycosyltransferase family 87 protein [Pirellulaceae bacterium]
LALATLGAWWLADRRPWASAACLAVACIKPTFGGPLLVLMLLRGNYRAAFVGLALAVVANLAVLALFLPHELTNPRPLELLAANQAATESDSAVDPLQSASRVDLPFVVERLWGQHLPGFVRFGLSLILLAVAGWSLRCRASDKAPSDGNRELLSAAFACLTIAICIYHNIYDALLVAVPGVAAWRVLADAKEPTSRWWGTSLMICLVVPALSYFSSKQFLTLLAEFLPQLAGISSHAALWTLLCTLNGISLTIAWCLLLVLIRRELRTQRPQPRSA